MPEIKIWCALANKYVTEGDCAANCAAPEQRPVCWMEEGRKGVAAQLEYKRQIEKAIVRIEQLTTAYRAILPADGPAIADLQDTDTGLSSEGTGQANPEGQPEGLP